MTLFILSLLGFFLAGLLLGSTLKGWLNEHQIRKRRQDGDEEWRELQDAFEICLSVLPKPPALLNGRLDRMSAATEVVAYVDALRRRVFTDGL